MSTEKTTEIIGNYKIDTLYQNDFRDGKGKLLTTIAEDAYVDIEVSTRVRLQIQISYIKDKNDLKGFKLVKYKLQKGQWEEADEKITLSKFSLEKVRQFLSVIQGLNLGELSKSRISLNQFKEIDEATKSALENLLATDAGKDFLLSKGELLQALSLKQEHEKRENILAIFREKMTDNSWTEPDWQKFFEENKWIFGYSLNIKIINGQTTVSRPDYRGKGEQKVDLLCAGAGEIA